MDDEKIKFGVLTDAILSILRANHGGLNWKQVQDRLDDKDLFTSEQCIQTTLCHMKSRNIVKIDKTACCDGCGRRHNLYSLTEEGRIKLNEKVA